MMIKTTTTTTTTNNIKNNNKERNKYIDEVMLMIMIMIMMMMILMTMTKEYLPHVPIWRENKIIREKQIYCILKA